MGFRIEAVQFKHRFMSGCVSGISTGQSMTENDNYYTLIVGNNGCGKTSLMNAIANYYCETKSRYSSNTVIITNGSNPDRIIVTTNGIGDTFPIDESDRKYYCDLRYVYLGTRFYGNYSKKYLLERAALLFLESGKSDMQKNINKEICQFVGYGTTIKLRYSLKEAFKINGKDLKKNIAALRNKKNAPTDQEINSLDIILTRLNNGIVELWVDFSYGLCDIHGGLDLDAFRFLRKMKVLQLNHIMISKDNSIPSISFDNVSSGEANLLSSLLSLNSAILPNSLILIDEPEISLHPEWQMKYMSKIQSILSQTTGCHVVIASHSHFMVSDLNPNNSALVILEKKYEDNVCLLTSCIPHYSPYAWSAENILLEVFKVPSTRNFYFAQKIEEALELLGDYERNTERLKEINNEIQNVVENLHHNDPLKGIAEIILETNV